MTAKPKHPLEELVGKKETVKFTKIFAAVSNTDTQEGNGRDVDDSYHGERQDALIAAVGIGPMGIDGKVEERIVVVIPGIPGTQTGSKYLLLAPVAPVVLTDPTKLRRDMKTKALSKLSEAERVALGLK